ncbi:MAG: hypothetical protein JNL61_16880 [Rhizobiaceae bacterium]|nr:hypothetical protein [Rhizobiaceae bacterium]
MGQWFLLAPLLFVAGEAAAIERYTSTSMSCARISQALASGPAILQFPSSGGGGMRYDRYFGSRASCPPFQTAVKASVPASDTQSCQVYRCVDKNRQQSR